VGRGAEGSPDGLPDLLQVRLALADPGQPVRAGCACAGRVEAVVAT